jgi:WG containing repeat
VILRQQSSAPSFWDDRLCIVLVSKLVMTRRQLVLIAGIVFSSVPSLSQGSLIDVVPCQNDAGSLQSGFVVKYSDGQFGYIDQKGNWGIKPRFDMAGDFYEGLAAVQVAGRWGYINSFGRYAIPLRFFDAGPFSEGLAPVRPFSAVAVFGFINRSGRVVIRADYGAVRSFCEGLAAVWDKGNWGYINRKGEIVIEPKFKDAFDFSRGIEIRARPGAECESNPCSNLRARAELRLPACSENRDRTDRPVRWSIREAATIQLLSLPATRLPAKLPFPLLPDDAFAAA